MQIFIIGNRVLETISTLLYYRSFRPMRLDWERDGRETGAEIALLARKDRLLAFSCPLVRPLVRPTGLSPAAKAKDECPPSDPSCPHAVSSRLRQQF